MTDGRDQVTVGIDIGTTSVKALAVDGDGHVVARSRVQHAAYSPAPDLFEHDAEKAWRRNVRTAFRRVSEGIDARAVNVAAMVPSLCAVDRRGRPITPGLLYGDARGGVSTGENPTESGEVGRFLEWCAREAPGAAGYWPAQAVANFALCGVGAVDSVVAITAHPLFDYTKWDDALVAAAGTTADKLPEVVPGNRAIGTTSDGVAVGGGTVDALAEQLVAGADGDGDVLVILGTTLITWGVIDEWYEIPGLWTIPHTSPGKALIGGASNAGGLFLNWALRLLGRAKGPVDPDRVPVWLPYVRGERTPLHDATLRSTVHDLDLTHGAAAARRAAYEASGFVVRRHLELGHVPAKRIVATGGGTRVAEWLQAVADCTGLPLDVVGVPEGGALGAAFLARVVAGLEESTSGAARWATTAGRVDPDPVWARAALRRYDRFVELTEAAVRADR
jgi:xylulokinase